MTNPISEGIKRLRSQHKLTQTKLAEMADIPRATLANMENDQSNSLLHFSGFLDAIVKVYMEAIL